MAGEASERQETGLVNAINSGFGLNRGKPFTLRGVGGSSITDCVRAEKFMGRSSSGNEPYTDVIVHRTRNRKVNLSCKGTSAPSIAGGGLDGLEVAAPGLTKKFLDAALKRYKEMGFSEGMSNLPDMYGRVSAALKQQIVVGTVAMGGPIDYMYIGPMNVTSSFSGGVLSVNGTLTGAVAYANSHDLFLRLRKRRADQPFTEEVQSNLPVILGRSPSRGDKGRRIVTTTSTPSNAEIVTF